MKTVTLPIQKPVARVGSGVVYCPESGEILLLQRKIGPEVNRWTFPGGKVEFGERTVMAMVRELEEETGLCVDEYMLDMIGFLDHIEFGTHFSGPVYLVTLTKEVIDSARNVEPEKHQAIGLFSLRDLSPDLMLTYPAKVALACLSIHLAKEAQ